MDKRLYVELPPFTGRNVPITEIAKAIGKDAHYVRIGIQQGILKFGVAMKMGDSNEFSYYCSDRKVWEETGYFNGEVKKQGRKSPCVTQGQLLRVFDNLSRKFSISKALREYNENFKGVELNIFQVVKENVTARKAAEQYGLKVSKNGMVCCPFHDDRHPSMKVDKGFCCFACGAKGDVIRFVADFFHLAPLEAAKKLAEDFQIPIFTDSSKKRNASKKKEKPKRTLYQTEKKFEEWERESIHILSDYLHLLEKWKVNHAPKMPDEEWKAEFIEACQQTERINYYLDLWCLESYRTELIFIG